MPFTLPQNCKVVQGWSPKTDAAGTTGDYVCLKNVHKMWAVFNITQGNAATIACGFSEATAVAGTSAAAVTATDPVWSNLDTSLTDTNTRRTDAASYTTDAGVKNKVVILEFDPAKFSAGFDCIAATTGASNIANLTSCMYYLQERYPQGTPPSAIID